MEIVIVSGAEADLWSAWVHYEELAPGLGDQFDQAILAGLKHLAEFPASGPIYHGEYRRFLLRRLDYGIFYRLHNSRLVVVAVLHLKQDPSNILQRLRNP